MSPNFCFICSSSPVRPPRDLQLTRESAPPGATPSSFAPGSEVKLSGELVAVQTPADSDSQHQDHAQHRQAGCPTRRQGASEVGASSNGATERGRSVSADLRPDSQIAERRRTGGSFDALLMLGHRRCPSAEMRCRGSLTGVVAVLCPLRACSPIALITTAMIVGGRLLQPAVDPVVPRR